PSRESAATISRRSKRPPATSPQPSGPSRPPPPAQPLDHEDPRNKAWSSMLASNPVPTLNQQKADLGIPRDSLKPHPALVSPRGRTTPKAAALNSGLRRRLRF